MDSDNNITTTPEETPKTIEEHEKLPETSSDPNHNPPACSEEVSAVASITSEVLSTQDQVITANTVTTAEAKSKDNIFKNITSDKDLSSEDLELKWEEDSDMEETKLDDTKPGLIESLGMSNTLNTVGDDDGTTKAGTGDDGLSIISEGGSFMDVDTSNADDNFDKTNSELGGKNVDALESEKKDKDSGNIKEPADSSMEKDLLHTIATKEDNMEVDIKEVMQTLVVEGGKLNLTSEPSKNIGLIEESSKPDSTVTEETKIQEKNLKQETNIEPCSLEDIQSSISEPGVGSNLKQDVAEPIVTSGENFMTSTSLVQDKCIETLLEPNTGPVNSTKLPNPSELSQAAFAVKDDKIDQQDGYLSMGINLDTAEVPEIGKDSTEDAYKKDYGKKKNYILEPDSLTEVTESGDLSKVSLTLLKELSDAEDDDLTSPSKEEEDLLLAETDLSATTETQIKLTTNASDVPMPDVLTAAREVSQASPEKAPTPAKILNVALESPSDTTNTLKIDVKSSENIDKDTESSVSTSKPDLLKRPHHISDTAVIEKAPDAMVVDEVPVPESLALVASTSKPDASKNLLDSEAVACQLSAEVKLASNVEPVMPMVTDTTDSTKKIPVYPDTQMASGTLSNTGCLQNEATIEAMDTDDFNMGNVISQHLHTVQTEAMQFDAKKFTTDAALPSEVPSNTAKDQIETKSDPISAEPSVTVSNVDNTTSAIAPIALSASKTVQLDSNITKTVETTPNTSEVTQVASKHTGISEMTVKVPEKGKINPEPSGAAQVAMNVSEIVKEASKSLEIAPIIQEPVKVTPNVNEDVQTASPTLEIDLKAAYVSDTQNKIVPGAPKTADAAINSDGVKIAVSALEMVKTGPDALEIRKTTPAASGQIQSAPKNISETVADTTESRTQASDATETNKIDPNASQTAKTVPDTVETGKTFPIATETGKIVPKAIETGKTIPDSTKTVKIVPDAMETAKTVPDTVETGKTFPIATETGKPVTDAVKTAKSVLDALETVKIVPKAIETGKTIPDSTQTVKIVPDAMETAKTVLKATETGKPIPDDPETAKIVPDDAKIAITASDAMEIVKSVTDTVETNKTAPVAPETVKPAPVATKTDKIVPDAMETAKTVLKAAETGKTIPDAPETSQTNPNDSETAKIVPDDAKTGTTVPSATKTATTASDAMEIAKSVTDTAETNKAPETVKPAPDTIKTDKIVPDVMETAKTVLKATETGKPIPDDPETAKIVPDDAKTGTTVPGALETARSVPDDAKTATTAPDAMEIAKSVTDTIETNKASPVAPETVKPAPVTSATAIPAPDTTETKGTDPPRSTAPQTGPEVIVPVPSLDCTDTLRLLEDASDGIPDFTDSLGLLAESSRPIDEEEEQEMEEDDDGDDDDDVEDDQDDESNLPTADQSEDSNAQTSENDISEDGFRKKRGVSAVKLVALTIADVPCGTDIVSEVGGEAMDLDQVFDELLRAVDEDVVVSPVPKETDDDKMDVDNGGTKESKENKTDSVDSTIAIPDDQSKAAVTPPPPPAPAKGADTPSKPKTLSRCTDVSMNVVNIVELEESSSEDDVQDTTVDIKEETSTAEAKEGETPDVAEKQEDTVSKPAAKTRIRLNTDELTIKTAAAGTESTLVIPEAKLEDIPKDDKPAVPKFSLEVFSLDSDEEDSGAKGNAMEKKEEKPASPKPAARCANTQCRGPATAAPPPLKLVGRRAGLCHTCAQLLDQRMACLMEGVQELKPLLELDMDRPESDLVEISDSDSEDGGDESALKPKVLLGEDGAKMLEEQLADMINSTWRKYQLDERLAIAKEEIELQTAQLQKEQTEIDKMLDECQVATDTLRRDLYAAFALRQRQLPSLEICDTLHAQYARIVEEDASDSEPVRRSKRPRAASKEDYQAKRAVIPLGFTSDGNKKDSFDSSAGDGSTKGDDDYTDIKVIALSAESAPTGLPAHGTLTRAPVAAGMSVYAMKHAFGAWLKATILQVPPRAQQQPFTTCKVRFEQKAKPQAMISARHLAYSEPADVRLTIGTRVIALFSDIVDINKRKSYYSGVIAEMPNPVNNYRYLVFFDDGYAQYVSHADTRVVCECSPLVWEEVHPYSREFVHQYLRAYPERPMVRLHAGQTIKTEWNGKWWVSRVIKVDASLVQVHFEADNRHEWIYRGSTRLAPLYLELQAAERHRARPLPRSTQGKRNMPYVEYTRSDEQEVKDTDALQQQNEEMRRQRSVAKKSTTSQASAAAAPPAAHPAALDTVMSRVVYYTPKAAVKPYKMEPHICSAKCKRTDVLPLKELRTYNPLARPLLSGWERQLVRHRGRKEVLYRAPCGRRLRDLPEVHRYLRATGSDMAVDLFDFSPETHCLAEFVLNRCIVSKKDLSHGKENVPVPCVNYYDTSLPEFCSYNTERTPTAGVPLNLDPEFLCGCDCEDDCQDKSKCNCWKMTLDGARTVGQDTDDVGYVYKRLLDPVPSGIYECNSRCKCKHTCLNRVAQHPLQLKLQVFKTPNRGWGIRALNDVPRGAFLCVYAGNLLTDATANLDGLNEGDEYLAELDYIEVVEQMKEGYEEDIPDKDKDGGSRDSRGSDSAPSSTSSSSEDEGQAERDDGEFRPVGHVPPVREFSKRLRRREKKEKDKNETEAPAPAGEKEKGDCITISDDEEVREPSRFMAQTDMGSNNHVSKYRSVRSLYGKDEACYIMDAKVQGNIGRYLNNVFVDTHDPRFPWVAFFALSYIRAGTELTWNYNYDVGSVPDKILYCYCGAANCRGRLL